MPDSKRSAFVRQPYVFDGWVGTTEYPAAPGRYHLYVSPACPWAHRSIIVRALKGLSDVVTMSIVDPVRDDRGWAFRDPFIDPVNGFAFLQEAYLATDPGYRLRPTVPALWDRESARLVSNRFDDIELMLATEFETWADTTVDLYPVDLRGQIDELNDVIYRDVNNGVYRCGFATSQDAYDGAFDALFARLDRLDERLGGSRFLLGDRLTESDVRLFTTLARFDAVYYTHFKCNLRRIVDYPNLWPYARDIYQRPGIAETVDFDHIKRHYYLTHPTIDPTSIVPRGPELDWLAPHDRP